MSKVEEKIKEICESITRILAIFQSFRDDLKIASEAQARITKLLDGRVKTLEGKVKWLENDNDTLELRREGFHRKEEVEDE